MTKVRSILFIFSLLLATNVIAAQELDQKVVMIQNQGQKAEGRVLEADYDNLGKNGTKVQLSEKKDTPNQLWKIEATANGASTYYIQNQSPNAGKYKYLEAAWTTLGHDGGKVQLWKFNGGAKSRYGANQVWKLIKNEDGSYSIISAHLKSNGKVLTADSFTQMKNGGIVHLFLNTNQPNQTWNLLIKT